MPQLTERFGPIPLSVVLNGSGGGQVTFQPNGSNARITNLFVKVSTTTNQAICTMYKGQIADSNIVSNTNSGSTGAPATGAIDLQDGETLYIVWTGGDAGATAFATVVGHTIPFDELGPSQITWDDPIAAGDGSLIYPSIHSPDFVTGVGGTGWSINRDGTFELNSGTIRGQLDVTSPSGAFVRTFVDSNVAQLLLHPPDDITLVFGAANIFCQNTTDGPALVLEAPSIESPSFQAGGTIYLVANDTLSQTAITLSAQRVVIGDNTASTTTTLDTKTVTVTNDNLKDSHGHQYVRGENGNFTGSFTTQSSATFTVTFAHTFSATPQVCVSIENGAAATARVWHARGISVTTTGFTFFVFSNDSSTSTWSNIKLTWIATEYTA